MNETNPELLITQVAKHWSYWQPDVPFHTAYGPRPDGQPERRRGGQQRKTISLADFDPAARPFSLDADERDDALMTAVREKLSQLLITLTREKRQKVLVVIQGTDASAPADVVKELFDPAAAAHLRMAHWSAPSNAREPDYLWRFHQQTPAAGELTVFDRGHYAELLAPVVNHWVSSTEHHQRIGHINDFERMLSHTGTVILKFMLHVGAAEHQRRLQARWRDPEQGATLSTSDFDTANQWDQYQTAYETMLSATHTPWAPWTVVPANCPRHRNLMMAAVLHQVISNLDT